MRGIFRIDSDRFILEFRDWGVLHAVNHGFKNKDTWIFYLALDFTFPSNVKSIVFIQRKTLSLNSHCSLPSKLWLLTFFLFLNSCDHYFSNNSCAHTCHACDKALESAHQKNLSENRSLNNLQYSEGQKLLWITGHTSISGRPFKKFSLHQKLRLGISESVFRASYMLSCSFPPLSSK